jgi:hapalindole H/12-epi-hapalindole U/12-epi-fischerindole U synthase
MLLLGILMAWSAPAVNLPVANAGFESNAITSGAFAVLTPTGWSRYDPAFIINNNANAVGVIRPDVPQPYFPGGAPEGAQAALVFLAGAQNAEAGLQQTLTSNLQANTRYRCSVQVGNIASGTSLPGSADGGGVYYNLDGFPGYRIDLLAGGAVIASDSNSIAATIPEGEFRAARFYFDVTNGHPRIGQPLGIRVVNLKQPGTPSAPNIEVDFDAVVITSGEIPVAAQLDLTLVARQPNLSLAGTPGATYRVESAAQLAATSWASLTNVLMTQPAHLISGFALTNSSNAQFFRAVLVD